MNQNSVEFLLYDAIRHLSFAYNYFINNSEKNFYLLKKFKSNMLQRDSFLESCFQKGQPRICNSLTTIQ